MTSIKFAALAAAAEMSTADKISEGLKVVLLGMATVFVVLAVLWFILYLFKVFFYREKSSEPKKAAAPAPVKTAAPAPAPAPVAAPTDDGALIAAITAAIAAYTADDASFASGFRVVSFRRSEHASPWTRNGK